MSVKPRTSQDLRSNQSLRSQSNQCFRAAAQNSILSKPSGIGITLKDVSNAKNTAILTMDELQRIRMQCSMGDQLDQEYKATERIALQEKSRGRVQNWPNTLEALRRKKDEERIKRLEEDELARRKIDAQEYELQVQDRLLQVNKANKHMHDTQDQVKAFHSKMLLCDTIQEREQQLNLRKRKQQMEKEIEKQWEELENQKLNEYDEKLRQKLMQEYNNKIQNAKIINDQLYQFKMKCIKRFQEEQLEGELIRRQVEQEQQKERQKEYQRHLQMLQQRESLKQANDKLIEAAALLKQKETEEELKIGEYAQKRDGMNQLRKDKEQYKFNEKQQTRQKMIDKQIEHLKTVKNKEDEILNKQVNEAEEKALKLFQEQERRKFELKSQIERSRQQQIEKRQNEKQIEQNEEKQQSEFWKIRCEELQIAEQQEKEEDRKRKAELQAFLSRQVENKQKMTEENFKKELQLQSQAQALLDHNEKHFYSYAEQCIQEWQDSGKNIKPLILELKTYKRRLIS